MPISRDLVTADFAGVVTAPGGEPLAGARIRLGGAEAVTDALGRWTAAGARVPVDGATVEIAADGYLPNARTLLVEAGGAYDVATALLPGAGAPPAEAEDLPGIASALPDLAVEPPGAQPAVAYAVDLTSEAAARYLPGDLRELDSAGVAGVVEPLAAVLLETGPQDTVTTTGLTLTVPVAPGADRSLDADPELTVYGFDAGRGGWVPVASASPVSAGYRATVGPLATGALLVGVPRDPIRITGAVTFGDDDALPDHGTTLRLLDDRGRTRASVEPDAGGRFAMLAPASRSLTLDVVDAAGAVVRSVAFAPSDGDLVAPAVEVAADRLAAAAFSGRVACGGTPLPLVPVELTVAGRLAGAAFTDSEGGFRLSAVAAPGARVRVSVYGTDLGGFGGQGASRPLEGDVDLGDLSACAFSLERARLLVDDATEFDAGQASAALGADELRVTSTPPGSAAPGLRVTIRGLGALPVGVTEASAGPGSSVELLGADGEPTDAFPLEGAPLELRRAEAGPGAEVVIDLGPTTTTNEVRQGGLYEVRGQLKIRAPQ